MKLIECSSCGVTGEIQEAEESGVRFTILSWVLGRDPAWIASEVWSSPWIDRGEQPDLCPACGSRPCRLEAIH